MRKSSFVVLGLFVVVACLVVLFAVSFPVRNKKFVVSVCKKYDLDVCLVLAVINVESGWDEDAVSGSGAVGVMQVMPSTADDVAMRLGLTDYDLTNFEDNVTIGCWYLRYLMDMFGDLRLSLCAYNAGPNNVRDWLNNPEYCDNGKLTQIPFKETRNYVKKVNFNKKVYDILI